jgi:hypothetical protein
MAPYTGWRGEAAVQYVLDSQPPVICVAQFIQFGGCGMSKDISVDNYTSSGTRLCMEMQHSMDGPSKYSCAKSTQRTQHINKKE